MVPAAVGYISRAPSPIVKRRLLFFDIVARRPFATDRYELVTVEFLVGRRRVRRALARALSPYTGNLCYSFAPRRAEASGPSLLEFTA